MPKRRRRPNRWAGARMRAREGGGRWRSPVAALALLTAVAGTSACGPTDRAASDGETRGRETGYRGILLPEPLPKPDFTLTDTRGEPFPFREATDGYATLLFFGYTHCPDICPVHMANLADVLEGLPHRIRRNVRVVFVTTDPERDTPERLRSWLDRFDPGFIGLRGELAEVNRIQAQLMLPAAVREPTGGGDYLVGHASQVIAFSADGEGRLVYPGGTRQADWAHDLPRLVADRDPPPGR